MDLIDAIARRRVPPAVFGAVLAAVLVAMDLTASAGEMPGHASLRSLDAWGFLLILASSLPMVFHHMRPWLVVIVVAVAAEALQGLNYVPAVVGSWGGPSISPPYLGVMAALFLTGLRTRARAVPLSLVVLLLAFAVSEALLTPDYCFETAGTISAVLAVCWMLGTLFKARRLVGQEAIRRAKAVEREQAANAREAVANERTRIARELHDIVAHNVSLMVVQTIAADRVLDRDHGKTHELHQAIEETGRATVAELRRLLDVLRTDDDDDADASRQPPQPAIDAIPELVEAMRAAGLTVEFQIAGTPRPLPAGSQLAAYRIVQEAFTNTLKHAGRTRSILTISWQTTPNLLSLRICDEGGRRDGEPLAGTMARGSGHGLVGMAERIAAVGGTLYTGSRPAGGFCVHATIPVPEPAPEGTTDVADSCPAGG